MTANEIQKMINQKGAATQQIFKAYTDLLKQRRNDGKFKELFDDDFIATYSYNCTILLLNKILVFPSFFDRECSVKERNRKRIRKDLETMKRLSYSDKYDD